MEDLVSKFRVEELLRTAYYVILRFYDFEPNGMVGAASNAIEVAKLSDIYIHLSPAVDDIPTLHHTSSDCASKAIGHRLDQVAREYWRAEAGTRPTVHVGWVGKSPPDVAGSCWHVRCLFWPSIWVLQWPASLPRGLPCR